MTRNPIARDVRTAKYKARVVKSKKTYSRKSKNKKDVNNELHRD